MDVLKKCLIVTKYIYQWNTLLAPTFFAIELKIAILAYNWHENLPGVAGHPVKFPYFLFLDSL